MKKTPLTLLFLLVLCLSVHAETLTLSTYYPAPFGSYDRLRLVPRAAAPPCDGSQEGVLYYVDNPINAINICQDDGTWGLLQGIWTQDANDNVYLTDDDSDGDSITSFVGIGTATPENILHIIGDYMIIEDTNPEILFEDSSGSANFEIHVDNDLFKIRSPEGPGNNKLTVAADGNVGIGTNDPTQKLHILHNDVTGGINVDRDSAATRKSRIAFSQQGAPKWSLGIDPSSANEQKFFIWDAEASVNRFIINSNGNVGIGIEPQQDFHVGGGGEILLTSGSSTGIEFETTDPGNNHDFGIKSHADTLWFWSRDRIGGSTLKPLTLTSTGDFGIGTSTPTAKLDVNGAIRVRAAGAGNTITGTLGDVAEYVNVSDENELELGDVVVIDRKNPLHFTRNNKPYDPLVGGIISDKNQAALAIGEEGKNKYLLALAGQVQCKVTAENGAIAIGDLLTTSSKPGYAMKATNPIPGTTLGKALESLEKDEGKIVVLVTLQ